MDEEAKAFLVGMESRVQSRLDSIKSHLETRLSVLTAEFDDKLHNLETRLLSEFWKWGRNTEQRMRRMEVSDSITTERMSALEERVFTIERKLQGSAN